MTQQPRKVRRRPSFAAFLLTGGIAGLLIGFVVSVLGPADTRYDASAALGFIGVIGAGLGALVAGLVAVLIDSRT